MDSGWIRWIFEQAYPIDVRTWCIAPTLDAGNLNAKYDVIIFPNGSIPALAGDGGGRRRRRRLRRQGRTAADIPEEFRGWIGNVTAEKTIPAAEEVRRERRDDHRHRQRHVDRRPLRPAGRQPPRRAAAERDRAAPGQREVLRPGLDPATSRWTPPTRWPTAWASSVDVFFDNSPVFRLDARRGAQGREAGRVVRLPRAAAQRLGVGPELPGRRRGGGRGAARQGQRVPVRPGGDVPRPAARHVQVGLQRDLPGDGDAGHDSSRLRAQGSRLKGAGGSERALPGLRRLWPPSGLAAFGPARPPALPPPPT